MASVNYDELSKVRKDEDMTRLGYKCIGTVDRLPAFRGKDVFYRLWCWMKDDEWAATLDLGNGYCRYIPWERIQAVDEEEWLEAVGFCDIVSSDIS